MRLPCAICTLAYAYTETSPTSLSWASKIGQIQTNIPGVTLLCFYSKNDEFWGGSATLAFTPWDNTIHEQLASELSRNTGSESAINFLVQKYHSCREQHRKCDLPRSLGQLAYPSRLLDVGTGENGLVILSNAGTIRDKEYVCLSHCWGHARPFTLNANTHSALTTGIRVTALPKTFQEAIFVTRGLGIQYLWIDSLCILQDSENDWAAESRIMRSIYAGAACTLAATAARDSNEGLFFDRFPQEVLPWCLHLNSRSKFPNMKDESAESAPMGPYICDVSCIVETCIEDAPLNQRAWVSQERQLSRRVAHFTRKQLFWECYECEACETYPKSLTKQARAVEDLDVTVLKSKLNEIVADKDGGGLRQSSSIVSPRRLDNETYYAWLVYRSKYTNCNLTYSTDKLVAIQGIATWVSQVTGDEFIAGFWKSRIIQELCWLKWPPTAELSEWRAPSWSWASQDTKISPSLMMPAHSQHANLKIEAELVDLSVKARASGQLEQASMKIKCKLLPASVRRVPRPAQSSDTIRAKLDLFGHETDYANITQSSGAVNLHVYGYLDVSDGGSNQPVDGYLAVIQQCVHASGPEDPLFSEDSEGEEMLFYYCFEHDLFEGLFLKLCCDETGKVFKRVGAICSRSFRAVRQVLEAHQLAEERVITLI